jgi:lipopolysaccharide heptosyltransferase II
MRRVLIVQPYGIGDLLFLTPVFRALRLIPSVEYVDILLGSRTDSVIRNNPHIDKIFIVDKDHFHRLKKGEVLREVQQLGRELRSRKYDLMLDYSFRGVYAFFANFFLGIKKSAGYFYKGRGFFHNIRVPLNEGFAGKHVTDFACSVAEAAGVRIEDRFLEFYPSARDREAAEVVLHERLSGIKNFAVVSPGGGESWGKDAHFKRWPAGFFADFMNRLRSETGIQGAAILGSRGEKDLAEEMACNISFPCVSLAGEISLETAAALIEKAALFVGNDGGLVHLAAALHRPVIALYGPVDPQVYGPYPQHEQRVAIFKENLQCRPCYKRFRYKGDCATRECLQDLKPAEAMDFLRRHKFFDKIAAHAAS